MQHNKCYRDIKGDNTKEIDRMGGLPAQLGSRKGNHTR